MIGRIFAIPPPMLQTPASFTPLMAPQDHPEPLTFLFYQGRLLVREEDLALPDAAAWRAVELAPHQLHPVGHAGRALCAGRLGRPRRAAGRGLRLARPALDVRRAAGRAAGLAGRAAQIAEWARTHRFCGACGKPMRWPPASAACSAAAAATWPTRASRRP